MGITVYLVAVPTPVLDALRRYPSVLDLVNEWNGDVQALRARAADLEAGRVQKFLLFGAESAELAGFIGHPDVMDRERCIGDEVKLDKAWAGIHFLLTGEPEPGKQPGATPLAWALAGSAAPLEGSPFEVAPAVVEEAAVREVAVALAGIDGEELRRRFDPESLIAADVYPEMWRQEDALDYLAERFAGLVSFYRQAAARGHAALICTSL